MYALVILGLRLLTGILYGFVIIIVTIIEVAGLLGYWLITGILYSFVIDNGGICYTNFTLSGNVLVKGMLNSFAISNFRRRTGILVLGLLL